MKTIAYLVQKIDGFIKIYGGIRYLVLFAPERYNATYDRTNYLIIEKSGITYSINHNFARIKNYSYNSLHIKTTLTFHNVVILIKSVVNKNDIVYNIFIEKDSNEDKLNTYFLK